MQASVCMGVLLAALVLSPVLAQGFQAVQLHKKAQRPSKALTAEGDVPLLNYLDAQVGYLFISTIHTMLPAALLADPHPPGRMAAVLRHDWAGYPRPALQRHFRHRQQQPVGALHPLLLVQHRMPPPQPL